MKNRNKILIVVAHPDDEVLGCGGTIAKYAKSSDIYIAILGEGIFSRYEQKEKEGEKEIIALRKQAQKAANFLGAEDVFFFDLPDNQFDTVPFLEIVKKIEKIIKIVRPQKIYTHHAGDLNIDHRIAFQAVLTATRPLKNCSVKEIYSFEVLSSTEWSFQKVSEPFSPNVFEDISKSWERKAKAMQIYKSEIREFPHPRSKEAIIALAKKWGSTAGVKYAEAFELIRSVK